MIKYLFLFLAIMITQLIAIIMWGEYVWLYKYANGGVGGTALEQINPIFWILIVLECILFVLFIMLNKKHRKA